MAISFDEVLPNRREPGHVTELNPTGIPTATTLKTTLLIGVQSTDSVEADATEVFVGADPFAQFGNCPLAHLAAAYRRIDSGSLLKAIPLDEASGTAATGSFDFTGTSTAAGTLRVRVGDRRYEMAVASGTAAASAASSLVDAIQADDRRYMNAALDTADCDLTAPQDGTHGNDISIAVESVPAGLSIAVSQPSSGATDPDTDDAIAAMGAQTLYDKIVTHLNSATELAKLEVETDLRWTAARNLEVMAYAAVSDTLANTLTFGGNRNCKSLTLIGSSTSPTPTWIWAAQTAARDAVMNSVPYTPRTDGWLVDCETPPASGVFDKDGRNSLLFSGISTFKVDNSGRVYLDRLITTYQTDPSGNADIAYLETCLMHELKLYGERRRALAATFNGYNIAQNGTNFDDGVKVTTPSKMQAAWIALYLQDIREGRCQDAEGYVESFNIEITGSNPYQVDIDEAPRFTTGLYRTRNKFSFSFGPSN